MNNFDQQLDHALHASAAGIDLPPSDLGGVMARTRTRRRRQGFAAATAVTLVAGSVAGVALNRRSSRPVSVAGSGGRSAVLKQGDAGVSWERVDPHSALGYASAVTSGGNLYALSTSPGVVDPESPKFSSRQLYRSSDGVEWTAATGPTDAFISDLSATGDKLYAVGTGPATVSAANALSPLLVSTSADRGATWQKISLPIDVASIEAGMATNHFETVNVVSSAHGVLVVAEVGGDLDVTKYLPAGVTAPNGWVVTGNGVDLLGPINNPPCPAGMTDVPPGGGPKKVAPTTVAPGTTGKPATPGAVDITACWSTTDTAAGAAGGAGSDPRLAPATIVPAEANHPVTQSLTWEQLGITGDLQQAAKGDPFVYFAPDGKSFHSVALPNAPGRTVQVQIAADGDNFVIAADSTSLTSAAGQEVLWQSTDGVTWNSIASPPADLAGPSAVGYLAGHLAIISGYLPSGPTVATLEAGGWSEAPLTPILGSIPDGTIVEVMSASIGPFGAAATVSIVGDPKQGTDAKLRGQFDQSLLVTRDGVTWSNQSLDKLAGTTVSLVAGIVAAPNRFIVTAQLPVTSPNTPAQEIVLVGTAS